MLLRYVLITLPFSLLFTLQWSFQLRTTDNINKTFHCESEGLREAWISAILHEIKQVRGQGGAL